MFAGRLLLTAVSSLLVACSYPAPSVDVSTRLDTLAAGDVPAGNTWPLPPEEAEAFLARPDLTITDAARTVGGKTGAYRVVLHARDRPGSLTAKWKRAPVGDADGYNNSPRRELAAYHLQRWLLPSTEYVVPTIAMQCIPVSGYAAIDPHAAPTVAGTTCILGTLAVWLEHVHVPDPAYDPDRFVRDARYAHHLANFNLITFLVDHQDAKADNFLAADDERNPRVFSVDNGITFGNLRHNYAVINWNTLHVPALTRRTVDQLRIVGPAQLQSLATVVEMHADGRGRLWRVPPQPPLDPDEGVRWRDGILQLGLTADEITDVTERIRSVLDAVDRGEVSLLD